MPAESGKWDYASSGAQTGAAQVSPLYGSASNGQAATQNAQAAYGAVERDVALRDVTLVALAALLIPLALTYLFAVNDETLALVIVFALIAGVVMLTRPLWGLILFVGLLYTRPEEVIPALNGRHFALLAAVLTLAGMAGRKAQAREKMIRTPLNGMILTFGLVLTLSTLGSGGVSDAAQDVAKLIALVVLTINLARTSAQYKQLVTAVLTFTLYLAIYSIYLYYFQGGGVKDHDVMRSQATGIFGDPNDLAAAILAGLALTMARFAGARRGLRLAYGVAALVMLWAIVITNSRGGILALIVVMGGYLLLFTRGKGPALLLAVVLGGGFLKFGPSRMSQMDSSEESANSRLVFWDNGFQQLLQHPLTGVGYGEFHTVNGGATAHNSFVLCFAELGLPGYFCWIGCLYYCFQNARSVKIEAFGNSEDAADKRLPISGNRVHAPPNVTAQPPAYERDAHFADRIGARLALAGYLAAAFWLSRTYVPNLYLLMGLCAAQQMTSHSELTAWTLSPQQRARDWQRIAFICLMTIGLIGFFAGRYK